MAAVLLGGLLAPDPARETYRVPPGGATEIRLSGDDTLQKSKPEHDQMREDIAKLRAMGPHDAAFDARFAQFLDARLHGAVIRFRRGEAVAVVEGELFQLRGEARDLLQQVQARQLGL